MTSLDSQRSYTLVEVFDRLQSPVRTDHDYFVASPPETLNLDAAQLRALEVRRPFFVDHGWAFGPDRDLVPFVWDPSVGGQPRFSEAEALTDYDSGLLGLASMSAAAPGGQAQLYACLTQAIIGVHRSNPGLLPEWLDGQGPTSREAFVYFDQGRPRAEEKLLAEDGTTDGAQWAARLDELVGCLGQKTFHKHHLRWIEFLAHAVDIPQLMRLIRAVP